MEVVRYLVDAFPLVSDELAIFERLFLVEQLDLRRGVLELLVSDIMEEPLLGLGLCFFFDDLIYSLLGFLALGLCEVPFEEGEPFLLEELLIDLGHVLEYDPEHEL